jgi:hypothetical protein
MSFVGKVSSVQSEIALTLTANAAVAMAGEHYIAIRADADYNIVTTATTQKVGFITATYAGRQWYFNNGAQLEKTYRWWFSDESDPEALDLSDFDGDWDVDLQLEHGEEPVHGAVPANTGLVVAKENETFIITGNSPNTFTLASSRTTARSAGCRCSHTAGASSGPAAKGSTSSTASRPRT